jgi:hypothetical protein
MEEAGLPADTNRWDLVFDFTNTDSEGNKLANFSTLDPAEFSIQAIEVDGFESVSPTALPVPQKYGGEMTDNDPSQR